MRQSSLQHTFAEAGKGKSSKGHFPGLLQRIVTLFFLCLMAERTNAGTHLGEGSRESRPLPFLQTDQILPSIRIGKTQWNQTIY